MHRKTILYIACSLDGYIAKPNDDLSFLSMATADGEDYGYEEFINSVDTVILGRKTGTGTSANQYEDRKSVV